MYNLGGKKIIKNQQRLNFLKNKKKVAGLCLDIIVEQKLY